MEAKKINQFRGKYYFLSNMYPCKVRFENTTYLSSESAFQASKCKNTGLKKMFVLLNGREAKKLGRSVTLCDNWDDIKLDIMYRILKSKFSDKELQNKLLSTGNAELIEGNTWNDAFWGVDLKTGKGENHLGKILMKIRSELKNN